MKRAVSILAIGSIGTESEAIWRSLQVKRLPIGPSGAELIMSGFYPPIIISPLEIQRKGRADGSRLMGNALPFRKHVFKIGLVGYLDGIFNGSKGIFNAAPFKFMATRIESSPMGRGV